jgi:hypothetical protein
MSDEETKIIEAIFSSILGHDVKISTTTTNTSSINSIKTIKEFISMLYKDSGFNFSYIIEQHNKQVTFDSLPNLNATIFIRTGFEDSFPIKCNLKETIAVIKQRIEDDHCIDQYHQSLIYNNIQLSDEKRLKDYKIRNNEPVNLQLKIKKFYIIFKIHRAITKILECSQTDTFNTILKKMRDNFMIPNLIIETIYKMDESFEKLGVKPGEIFFARKAHFIGGNLSIKIPCGKSHWLAVSEGETVKDLKKKIAQIEDLPVEQQTLVYNGEPLDDNKTLDYYEIQDQNTIQLLSNTPTATIRLNIKRLTGKTTVINNISLVDTIKNLKIKIHAESNEPVDKQCLIFDGKRLEDDKTISDYKIRNDDTVHLVIKIGEVGDFKIDVGTLNGSVYDVKLNSDSTIEDLKCKLNEKLNMPLNSMVIMFRSKNLDDHQTLDECGIKSDCLVHLLARDNEVISLPKENLLDSTFDYDFTHVDDNGKVYQRGTRPYLRPCGWKRCAIKAERQYEDDVWIGCLNLPGEWPVGYHGTDFDKIQDVISKVITVDQVKNVVYNKAHLTAVDIKDAEKFAKTVTVDGRVVKFVIQSRIRPENIIFNDQQNFMLLPSYEDLRPYGICYKYI